MPVQFIPDHKESTEMVIPVSKVNYQSLLENKGCNKIDVW